MKGFNVFIGMLMVATMAFVPSMGFNSSKTTVKYDSAKVIKVNSKLIVSQIEASLAKKSSDAGFDSAIDSYFKRNFILSVNGTTKQLKSAGIKKTDKTIWLSFEAPATSVKSIKVTNTLFSDKFSDQQNIVSFDINGKTENVILSKTKTTHTFSP